MASNIYTEQRAAFAQVKKIFEICEKNETPFDLDMVIVETLSSYAISERSLQKYIKSLRRLYPRVEVMETHD